MIPVSFALSYFQDRIFSATGIYATVNIAMRRISQISKNMEMVMDIFYMNQCQIY